MVWSIRVLKTDLYDSVFSNDECLNIRGLALTVAIEHFPPTPAGKQLLRKPFSLMIWCIL